MTEEQIEQEKELALSYYSQEDGNFYRLLFMCTEEPNGIELPLPDGSIISYEDGIISELLTGNRIFNYYMEEDTRGVLTEVEQLPQGRKEIVRHTNIFTATQWNRFSCDPNTYITDLGEELHFCLKKPEPTYEGKIIKIVDPYGECIEL
ncbi:MAG: hypothetical protein PF569_09380 [Candidatus Woesearchaeota archaeon]|jgi:hypothetical protein|nr:hypothetical protein [Candidatus Woesearchaeota archaeon]